MLLFSDASDLRRTRSSKKSLIMETDITNAKGGRLVGFPRDADIYFMHYKKQTQIKNMFAGLVI
jgi:hypothetical protein